MKRTTRHLLASLLIAGAGCGLAAAAWAAGPTTDQVYQAVRENRLDDAQAMMQQVLRDHPNSAQAHYVEAEVLVRMGHASEARTELDQAERLEPGLPFARPAAVHSLEAMIANGGPRHDTAFGGIGAPRPAVTGISWGVVIVIVAGVGLVLLLLSRARRAAALAQGGTLVGPAGGYGQGYAPGYPYGGAPMGGPGLGSSIMGGLATGAAVGAGMVAGEALAQELIGGHRTPVADASLADASRVSYDDDGGHDFGISNPDSWDSGGMGSDMADGGGGGDWS